MSSEEAIRVAVRVRPMIGREVLRGQGKNRSRSAVEIDEQGKKISVSYAIAAASEEERLITDEGVNNTERREKTRNVSCHYDHVCGPDTTQEAFYATVIEENVKSVVQGINCTVFAYGQTGTGKTYTILGERDQKGIVPRAVETLFESLKRAQEEGSALDQRFENAQEQPESPVTLPESDSEEGGNDSESDSSVKGEGSDRVSRIVASQVYCSYLQLYNEQLYDLLQDQKRQFPLKIRQSPNGQNYVQGLAEIRASTVDDVLQVLRRGQKNRVVRATEYNEASSRSHAILQLRVETEEQSLGISESRVLRSAKFNFVDLAGSEKWDTHIEIGEHRAKELQKINTSLSSLGNVVQALGEKDRAHVPYRDSKLTHLLQDSLGGNTRTIIICTLSPVADALEESISTLKFGDRAKQVMVNVTVNEVVDDSVLLAHAQAEIARLKRLLRTMQKPAIEGKTHRALVKQVKQLKSENQHLRQLLTQQVEHKYNDSDNDKETHQDVFASNQEHEMDAEESGRSESEGENEFPIENVHQEEQGEQAAASDQNTSDKKSEAHVSMPESSVARPAPSDILSALKEELALSPQVDPTLENDKVEWNEDQERAFEEMEEQCFDELSHELETLQNLKAEREKLERAMRALQKSKKGKGVKKRRHPHLKRSPLLSAGIPTVSLRKNEKKKDGGLKEKGALSFSARDVGKGIELYAYRMDAWYKVDIINFDPKSGMHRVKYRDDGSEQWHQMESRRYKLAEPTEKGKTKGIKSLLRGVRVSASKQMERDRVAKAINKRSQIKKEFEAYGGLEALWDPSKDALKSSRFSTLHSQSASELQLPNLDGISGGESHVLNQLEEEGLKYSRAEN